jgi:hypothetical protein
MSIQHPGGTIVSSTFTGALKQDIVAALETHLTAAGWSVVSGSGSTDVLMQSASTPTAANSIRVRLRSTNLTNCACVNMQNAAGTKVSQNHYLLPAAAKTFRVLANKYQWFCFVPGTSVAREYVAMGVPYTPSFLHGVLTGDLGWIQGNADADASTTTLGSFRTRLHSLASGNANGGSNCGGLANNSLMGTTASAFDNHTTYCGTVKLIIPYPGALNASPATAYRWHDNSLHLSDPLIAWGLTAPGDEAKIRGQLWGAMIASDTFAGDTVLTSVDGHDWLAVTNSNAGGGADARGTLFVAIT